jgi:CHAT domain-containing protein/Tfp pilus assembly protein PilF
MQFMRLLPKIAALVFVGGMIITTVSVLSAAEPDKARWEELIQRCRSLRAAGKYTEAIQVGEESAKMAKSEFGADSRQYGISLNILTLLYLSKGKYSEAVKIGEESVNVAKTVFGQESSQYAASLNNLAQIYEQIGVYDKAESLHRKAIDITKKILGENHPSYATSLNNLAMLYHSRGEYAKAEPLFKQALEIIKKSSGEDHPKYASILNNLAVLYHSMGEYAKAEPLFKQALEIIKKSLGEDHPNYTAILESLAMLYLSMGEYAKTEPLLQKTMEITKKTMGENHPDYATSLNNLAGLYESMGDYAKAETLHKKAMDIRKGTLGEKHPDYAASLNNLSLVYYSMGEYAKAEPLQKKAIEITKKILGEKHPDYATNLNNLASLYYSLGDYDKSEPLYQQELEIIKESLGKDHPAYARSLNNLALLYAACDKETLALTSFDNDMKSLHSHTTKVLIALPEHRQIAFLHHIWFNLELFISFVYQHMDLTKANIQGEEWLARWKGLAAEIQTEKSRIMRQGKDPKLQALINELTSARQRLAEYTLSPPVQFKPEDIQTHRDTANQKVAELESKLAQESSQFAEINRIGQAKLADIAAAMPADSILLDYAKFRDFNFKAKGKEKRWGDWRYIIFVTAAGKDPQPIMVDLGPAKPIDEAIADFRNAMGKAEKGEIPKDDKEIREKLAAVRKLIIDPAMPHIKDKRHWIICPDGQISLVPFEALPIEDGKYLIEIKKLSYLGAGREAVAYAGPLKEVEKPLVSMLMGNPDFDLTPVEQQVELQRIKLVESVMAMRGIGGSRDIRQVLFPPLPATGPEVETAAGLLGGQKYLKRQALEGVVKSVTHPEVLYLATHGFFLPDQELISDKDSLSLMTFTTRGMNSGNGRDAFDLANPGPRIENPMLRCGLALAGANRREAAEAREDVDDGILTGMEIAGLDLWGTKLVVLSACQTGLGDVQQGEGVMGLRRAFLLGGARRVLATLWMVPDQQTRELMVDFLTRWKAGKPAVDALREAQITMITHLRKDRGQAHPFYWAAFTMTGDWR